MIKLENAKRFLLTIFSFILIIFQYSCKHNNFTEKITIASAGKIQSLDPARVNTLKAYQLLSALGDTLYEINMEGELVPRLAESMPFVSKSKLKIIIKLKRNIFFHDGTPFDSSAMKFSIERFQNIGTNNYILDNKIRSIDTPNKELLIINLKEPFSSIEGLLTSINLTAVSPTFYKNHFNKFLNEKFIGTGKYKLERFTNEIQILSPNLNHWDTKPRNKGINFIGYNNSSTLYGALRSNQIDVLLSNSIEDTLRNKLNSLSLENKIKQGESKPIELSFISLRTNNEPLNNRNLRLAIAKSLNRELIINKVSFGLRDPAKSIIPDILKKDYSVSWPVYDPYEAIKIFKKEGYCYGKTFNLPLTYRSNVPTDKLIAFYWQQSVKSNMGNCFSINLNGVESTTIYKNLKEGIYPAVILDWTGAYSDPEAYLTPLLSCNILNKEKCLEGESVFSGSFWASKEVQKLFLESEYLNNKERLSKLIKIEKIAAEELPYIPIWISSQKAWSQTHISEPLFNASGRLIMSELTNKNEK